MCVACEIVIFYEFYYIFQCFWPRSQLPFRKHSTNKMLLWCQSAHSNRSNLFMLDYLETGRAILVSFSLVSTSGPWLRSFIKLDIFSSING